MIAKVYLTTNAQERTETAKFTYVELTSKTDSFYFAEPYFGEPEKIGKYLDIEKVCIIGYFPIYEREI
jgi:5-methylthioribose kinase